MIRELERALSGAFADSEDVHEVLRRLRDEGYGLVFLLDRRDGEQPTSSADGTSGGRPVASGSLGNVRLTRLSSSAAADSSSPAVGADDPPAFRIDAADLAFLRSIGIDPTRKIRGRRTPRKSSP